MRGPWIERTWSLTQAASVASPRSGLATATTGCPASSSRSTTWSQLEESAKAPWTSTMVGRMSGFLSEGLNTPVTVAPGSPQPLPCEALVRAPVGPLGGYGCPLRVRERAAELLARADAQLREHLVQVGLHGARADEQLGADLRIRLSRHGAPGDLRLLRRERVARLEREPAHRLAGGRELACRALGERFRADAAERLVRRSQLLARIDSALL